MRKITWKWLLLSMGVLTAMYSVFYGEIMIQCPIATILFYLASKEEN